MHLEALDLGLMRPDDGQQSIPLQKLAGSFCAVEIRATSSLVVLEEFLGLAFLVFDGISPQQIALS